MQLGSAPKTAQVQVTIYIEKIGTYRNRRRHLRNQLHALIKNPNTNLSHGFAQGVRARDTRQGACDTTTSRISGLTWRFSPTSISSRFSKALPQSFVSRAPHRRDPTFRQTREGGKLPYLFMHRGRYPQI